MKKLGVKTDIAEYQKRYNTGISTQVPTGRMIAVKSRISRKIGYNGIYINYERTA